jgi:hypothetical protein
MTIEIRQLVVRVIVQEAASTAERTLKDPELIARCTREVLRRLARQKDR